MSLVTGLIVVGIMIGTLYGLLGVSLTLMLRTSGVLSFAHAGFALVSAYLYSGLVCRKGTDQYVQCQTNPWLPPVWAAVVSVLAAVVVALLTERLVARPLQRATLTTKVIATAGVLSLVSGLLLQLYGPQPRFTPPEKQLLPTGGFTVGSTTVSWPQVTTFGVSVSLVLLLGLLLRKTWFGLGLRAAGQSPDVARLMGVRAIAVARFNWALGGLLAGLAGVLIGPVTSVNIATFSFLLLKAVGATLIGGLISLPVTFVGGIGIGVVEIIVPHYWRTPGADDVAIAALIVMFMRVYRHRFSQAPPATSAERRVAGRRTQAVARFLAAADREARALPRALWILVGLGLLALPFASDYHASIGVNGLYYAILALSVVVITGTTGQVTFMQAGFVALGAFGLSTALAHGWNLFLAIGAAMTVSAVIAAVVGFGALRFRGLEFAVVSIALGAVLSEFVVTRSGVEAYLAGADVFGLSMLRSRNLYGVMLVLTVVLFALVANLRRSVWGRSLQAMREIHAGIGHFGADPLRSEIVLLSVSAAAAALAGCLFALIVVTTLDPFLFTPLLSIVVVLAAVVGGMRSLWGAALAGMLFGPGQEVVGRVLFTESANAFPQIASAALALIIVIKMPDGLASAFATARAALADRDTAADHRSSRFGGIFAPPAPAGRLRRSEGATMARLGRAPAPSRRLAERSVVPLETSARR